MRVDDAPVRRDSLADAQADRAQPEDSIPVHERGARGERSLDEAMVLGTQKSLADASMRSEATQRFLAAVYEVAEA